MDLYQSIQRRYSCRAYQSRPVPDEVLLRIMEAVRLAPSARNSQNWKFYWVQNPELKRKLQIAANNQSFVAQADCVVVGVGTQPDHIMRCGHPAFLIDLSIAMEHLALAAAAEGLGTCWIGAFYQDPVIQVLDLPASEKPVQLMTVGYPADQWRPKARKPLSDIMIRR
ncbi:MAG: nitroreductase family protein [Candidatus Delongbacteria bacterium]|nr:nitroreductase family protein [Candidatus Delongbacteria bacterium]